MPDDLAVLAEWNHYLIQDEGHRNPMTVPELQDRMKGWLKGAYQAAIFTDAAKPVGYALYRVEAKQIYLRQLFILRDIRRKGYGRGCFELLRTRIWPPHLRITVEVLCHNPAAIAFWRAVGFVDYCLTLEIMPEG